MTVQQAGFCSAGLSISSSGLSGGYVGKSGNPAKAAQQRSLEEAKAGVRQGKTIRVNVSANTEVLIKSTDPEEAADVVDALQPAEEQSELTPAYMEAFLANTSTALVMFGYEDKYKRQIRRWLAEESKKWSE